jgi:hypothetical protein
LSYDKSHPNPGERPRLGVIALAEINGPGAYERRYEATRRALRNAEADEVYTIAQKRAMSRMSPARRASFKRMIANKGGVPRVTARSFRANRAVATAEEMRAYREGHERIFGKRPKRKKKATAKRKAGRKLTKAERRVISLRNLAKARAARKTTKRRSAKSRPKAKRKLTKAERRLISLRNLKKARAARKKTTKSKSRRAKPARLYAGKYRAIRARVGPMSRRTYKYKTKGGAVRDIPDYALLGFKSAAQMRQVTRSGSAKRQAATARRLQKLTERRERDAERAAARIRAGRGMFTPNAETLTFEEWEHMRPNRSKKKASRKKKLTKAQRKKISLRNLAKARAARKKKTGGRKKTTSKRRKTTSVRRAAAKRRTSTKKRVVRRRRKLTKAQRRAISLRNLKKARVVRRSKRGRVKVKRVSRSRVSVYAANRRRGRKTYRRNQGSYAVNQFASELGNALKLGALVMAGFAIHRALTHAVDEYGLKKIEALNTGSVAPYRGVISGFLTAAIGVLGAVQFAPKDMKNPVAAGMTASFIHGAIVTVLNQQGQSAAVAYLAGYPDARGRAYGSYYTTRPQMSGYGSYYQTPTAGFGQPMLTQAAAGMGQLRQAAAGMGQPMVTQAAAGTGEYIAYGVQGIGDYDEMPVTTRPVVNDEGIYPNLHSAEQALTIAEAAAGVGSAEIPLQGTVNPTMIADPISELPGGSRAGVFQGGDGIFG